MNFYTDPTSKARSTLYVLTLDRGMSWEKALAELEAANNREIEQGNTTHINGFYENKQMTTYGAKLQHLVIRKQYQYMGARQNNFYEMYRVIRPNKGLAEQNQRHSIESKYR